MSHWPEGVKPHDTRNTIRTLSLTLGAALSLAWASPALAITPAVITSPANGSVLPGSLVTFHWTPGGGVSDYWLCVSSIAPGQCEIYNIDQKSLDQGPTYSHTLAGLPTDGRPVYVRLFSQDAVSTDWYPVDFTYVAAGSNFVPSVITAPANGSDLTSSSVTFQWTAGANVSDHALSISNTRPGGSELYNADLGVANSATVSGLPSDGSTLYVRLASKNSATGNWFNVDYTYVAFGPFQPATMIFPAPGATFIASSAVFQWTPGVFVSDYALYVSSTAPGNGDIYSSDQGLNTTRTVTGLPVNGSPVYVRIASKNASTGAWTNQDYVYTSFTATGAAVSFLGTDWRTEGDWNGVYGQDGNVIAQSSTSPPSYSGWNPMSTTNLGYFADYSADPRGPLQPRHNFDPSAHLIAHFYNRYYMEFQVNTSDDQSHRIALYFADWQPAQPLQAFPLKRSITVRARDTGSGAILDTRVLSDYTAGVYLVYNYTGNVTFHIENNYPPVDTDGVTRDLPNGTVTAFLWGGTGLAQNGPPAALSIASGHTGNFTQARTGSYTIVVSNGAGAGSTGKPVTVTEYLPSGFTLVSMGGAGWTCSGAVCSRSDSLAAGASFSPIFVTVNVAPSATSPQANTVFVSGGTSPVASAVDNTVVNPNPPVLTIAKSHTGNFQQGQMGAAYTVTVSNTTGAGPTNAGVTVTENPPAGMTIASMSGAGWSCSGATCTRSDSVSGGASFPPISVLVNISADAASSLSNSVSVSGGGSATANATDSTTIIPTTQALRFVPVTPCRVVDTRNASGAFGGPEIAGGSSRSFVISNSGCGIPSSALAYSLNVAVVPDGPLGYLTLWPSGQTQPNVSTLNSLDGRIKSNAAIVSGGVGGAISVFASNSTNVILDINGYFVPASDASGLAFYPLPPCRVADTRNAAAPLGGPSIASGATRAFPILSAAGCNIPAAAQAYSLNFAAVPKSSLGYLTAWPAGQTQPLASTVNAPTGTVTANAAIVPAGAGGAIDVFASNATDLVIDINGYFAPPGSGGLSLYPGTPCRVLDTRQPAGSQPISGTHDVAVASSGCAAPPAAQAYVFGATVVPSAALGYLTLWSQGQSQPTVATLNALDVAVTSNLAIVPTANGSISVFPSNPTHLVLDLFGYFAP